jgi:hypothetical protein
MPTSQPASNHEARSAASDQAGTAPGETEASAKISEQSRTEEGFVAGADSVEWGPWWRKRLEADIEAAMQICRDGGDYTAAPAESARQKDRVTDPCTRNDHSSGRGVLCRTCSPSLSTTPVLHLQIPT